MPVWSDSSELAGEWFCLFVMAHASTGTPGLDHTDASFLYASICISSRHVFWRCDTADVRDATLHGTTAQIAAVAWDAFVYAGCLLTMCKRSLFISEASAHSRAGTLTRPNAS